jgi:large subunit ribosomal protein L10
MSKVIKQMEMSALKSSFNGIRDMVFLSVQGLSSITDNQIRLSLRKKGIRMQVVKNSLARRVFADMGMNIGKSWEGPTTVAWGGSGVADLSKEIEGLIKKHPKNFKDKGAVAEGEEITFAQALKMPTKAELMGTILGMVLSPASQIASQIGAPGSQIASQLKTLVEKKEKEEPAPKTEPEPAPAA